MSWEAWFSLISGAANCAKVRVALASEDQQSSFYGFEDPADLLQILNIVLLFTHNGDVEPLTESDILDRTRQSLIDFQAGPLMDYMPYTPNTRPLLEGLAALQPRTLATMHGSSFAGDGAKALLELDGVMKEMLGTPSR